jgi:hypothetical protein
MDGFLVEPQNQGRVGTTWEPSHEWRLAEATPSSRAFRWFTRKPVKQVAVAGHPSDGESFKSSKTALEGLISVVVKEGYFRLSVASI